MWSNLPCPGKDLFDFLFLFFSTSVDLESDQCVCICLSVQKLWDRLQAPKIVQFGWNLAHLFLGWIPGGTFLFLYKILICAAQVFCLNEKLQFGHRVIANILNLSSVRLARLKDFIVLVFNLLSESIGLFNIDKNDQLNIDKNLFILISKLIDSLIPTRSEKWIHSKTICLKNNIIK